MNNEMFATQLRQEADRLIKAADLLAPRPAPIQAPTLHRPPMGKSRIGARKLSAATRKKLSEGQQRRRERERAASTRPTEQAA